MKRFSGLIAALAGLGLLLAACVPIDGNTSVPTPDESTSSTGDTYVPPVEAPREDLPLQEYSTIDLDQRIAKLPHSMAAPQIQQGLHPIDYGVPGSEQVLLAEQLTASSRFALPRENPGDMVLIEVACSKSIGFEVMLFDINGAPLGGGSSSECSPGGPSGFGIGIRGTPQLGQVQLAFDRESGMELSVVTLTRAEGQ